MTGEPPPDTRMSPVTCMRSERIAREALDRAYNLARLGGYRADSREMHALRQAETRYQQAKIH